MKHVLTHIKRFFLVYIFFAVVGTFGIIWEFKLLTRAKESEKLDLFVCCKIEDETKFDKFLSLNIPEGCKEINTNYIEENNFIFSQNLSTYGAEVADIYILSKDKYDLVCTNGGNDNYFYKLDEEKSKELFGEDISFYSYEEKAYALKLESNFFEEDELYIGFAKNTKHIYSFNEEGTDFATELVRTILENEKI